MKIPEGLPRFFELAVAASTSRSSRSSPTSSRRSSLASTIVERAVFRVTRDADFEVSDDADDLLEAVESQLRRRRFGDVVRVEVSSSASSEMVARLQSGLGADETQIYRVDEPRSTSPSSWSSRRSTGRSFKYEPWIPAIPPRLASAQSDLPQIFDEIRRGDVLVHQPYGSFRASFETFAQAAVRDPNVIAMKTAVYRTSDDSVLVGSLIQCAEDGKQSVCLVELKARFDELRNIEWSRALEQAGVHVAYGFPDLKIHAKMTLIVRREGDVLRRYAHIGTGNYHAATARLYEDLGDLHRRRGDHRRRRRPLQLHHRFRPAAEVPEAARRAVHAAQRPRRRDPSGRRRGSRRASTRGSGSSSTISSTRRSSRSCTRRRAPVPEGRHHRALDLRAPPGRRRPVGEHPRPLDRRPLPRAQPRSTRSRRTSESRRTSGARISCSGISTTASRCSCRSRTRACARRSTAILDSALADDVNSWISHRRRRVGARRASQAGEARTLITRR